VRIYETTFIINPQTDDASIDREVRSVTDLITQNGGKIIHEDRLGTRRLAYPIKGLMQGYYSSFIFEGPIQIPPILDRHFKLGEAYLRYLTILFEGDVKSFMAPVETETVSEEKTDAARTMTAPVAEKTPHSTAEANKKSHEGKELSPQPEEEQTDSPREEKAIPEEEEEL